MRQEVRSSSRQAVAPTQMFIEASVRRAMEGQLPAAVELVSSQVEVGAATLVLGFKAHRELTPDDIDALGVIETEVAADMPDGLKARTHIAPGAS